MQTTYLSDIGNHRQNNEDAVGVFVNRHHHTLAIIADGLGGYHGGEVASAMAVAQIGHNFTETTINTPAQAKAWLNDQAKIQNRQILARAAEFADLTGMGTTLVAAIIFDDKMVVANVGDSRAYLLRGAQFAQISEDHSVVNELVKNGMISHEEAKSHPKKNSITQALGVVDDVAVRIKEFSWEQNDLLLLCSDGLSDMIDDRLIATVLVEPKHNLKTKAQELVKSAKVAGGNDNITVLLAENTSESNQEG